VPGCLKGGDGSRLRAAAVGVAGLHPRWPPRVMQMEREQRYATYVERLPFSHRHKHNAAFELRLADRANGKLAVQLPLAKQGAGRLMCRHHDACGVAVQRQQPLQHARTGSSHVCLQEQGWALLLVSAPCRTCKLTGFAQSILGACTAALAVTAARPPAAAAGYLEDAAKHYEYGVKAGVVDYEFTTHVSGVGAGGQEGAREGVKGGVAGVVGWSAERPQPRPVASAWVCSDPFRAWTATGVLSAYPLPQAS